MTIQVYYKGKIIRQEYVNIPGRNIATPFEDYVKEREETVNKVLDDFKHNKLEKIYHNDPNIRIAIVFQSRLSEIEIKERPKYQKDIPQVKVSDKPEAVKIVRPKAEYTNQRYDYDLL